MSVPGSTAWDLKRLTECSDSGKELSTFLNIGLASWGCAFAEVCDPYAAV